MNSYTERMIQLAAGRPPLEILESTPKRLEEFYRSLGPEGLKRSYAPGKWTAGQIICHLADVEILFGFRFRQVLAEDRHRVQTMEQDDWARFYADRNLKLAIESHRALRAWNLDLLRHTRPEDLKRVSVHPERGEETLEIMVKMLAGHDLNHLSQLEQIGRAAAVA